MQKNNIKKVAHAYRDKFLKIPIWNFFSYSIIKGLLCCYIQDTHTKKHLHHAWSHYCPWSLFIWKASHKQTTKKKKIHSLVEWISLSGCIYPYFTHLISQLWLDPDWILTKVTCLVIMLPQMLLISALPLLHITVFD